MHRYSKVTTLSHFKTKRYNLYKRAQSWTLLNMTIEIIIQVSRENARYLFMLIIVICSRNHCCVIQWPYHPGMMVKLFKRDYSFVLIIVKAVKKEYPQKLMTPIQIMSVVLFTPCSNYSHINYELVNELMSTYHVLWCQNINIYQDPKIFVTDIPRHYIQLLSEY